MKHYSLSTLSKTLTIKAFTIFYTLTSSSFSLSLFLSPHSSHATFTNPLPDPNPSGFAVELEEWITIPASNPSSSTKGRINHLKPCPDGTRLFCNDLRGKFWVIASTSATNATLFANLDTLQDPNSFPNLLFPQFIDSPGLGAGFTSFAFHPEFSSVGKPGYGKFYTAHLENRNGTADFTPPTGTSSDEQTGIITEWTMTNPADNALVASPANFSTREILRIHFSFKFHTLQEISFNPNALPGDEDYGCLFICVGDGGSIQINASSDTGRIDTVFGTILRIAPILAESHQASDFTLSTNGNYYIPSGASNTNPFVTASDPTPSDGFDVVKEIYAYGFRNPHRISWDTVGAKKMFCGIIGERNIEEVELIQKGGHYGWPFREGAYLFDPSNSNVIDNLPSPDTGPPNSPPEPATFTYPVAQYDHNIPTLASSGGKAMVGGYVYRGSNIPYLYGKYFCGDVVQGWVYLANEQDMVLQTPASSGDAPALLETLELLTGGTSTTLASLVGGGRADLRFGIDHNREIYILSKTNGKIYKLLPAGASNGQLGTTEDWTEVHNFESQDTSSFVSSGGTAQSLSVVDDPILGSSNKVLQLENTTGTSQFRTYLPIPEIGEGQTGTLFFRVYFENQNHTLDWGTSDLAVPVTVGTGESEAYDSFEAELRSISSNSGEIEIRNGGSFENAFSISNGVWYSVWMVMNNDTGTDDDFISLYVQGGDFNNPTLVKFSINFRNGTTDSLKTLLWLIQPGGASVYFDDIQVDLDHVNLTSPLPITWQLVDNFETANPLAFWDLPNPADQSNLIITEPNGNRYLERRASSNSNDNLNAIARRKLPVETTVGANGTLYFKIRSSNHSLYHLMGITSNTTTQPETLSETDFEAELRLSGQNPFGVLETYDGTVGTESFVHPTNPETSNPINALDLNTWYEIWIVFYDGGFASGGQKYDVYIRGGTEFPEQTQLANQIGFQNKGELPITHFLTIASTGVSGNLGNQALCLDDIYIYPGINLRGPFDPIPVPFGHGTNATDFILNWNTEHNRCYQVYYSNDLITWHPLGSSISGDGTNQSFNDPMTQTRRFYRITQIPCP